MSLQLSAARGAGIGAASGPCALRQLAAAPGHASQRRALRSEMRPRSSSDPQPSTSETEQAAPVYREFRSLGMKVVETDTPLPGPETEPDFWEGAQFESFGRVLENYFIPGVVVLAVLIGGWAAKNYNEDADIFIKPAGSPEQSPEIFFAAPPEAPELAGQ